MREKSRDRWRLHARACHSGRRRTLASGSVTPEGRIIIADRAGQSHSRRVSADRSKSRPLRARSIRHYCGLLREPPIELGDFRSAPRHYPRWRHAIESSKESGNGVGTFPPVRRSALALSRASLAPRACSRAELFGSGSLTDTYPPTSVAIAGPDRRSAKPYLHCKLPGSETPISRDTSAPRSIPAGTFILSPDQAYRVFVARKTLSQSSCARD